MKYLLTLFIILSFGFTYSNASNKKGIKAYKKLCIQCHGGPFRAAGMHTMDEWEEITTSSKTPMIKLHKDIPKALEKFDDKLNDKRRKYLFKFLIENAKDSGFVPGCNGSYCGQT